MNKILTISIPTFNRSNYLNKNLSFIHQQCSEEQNFELIVIDNASTDDTNDVVNKYQNMGLSITYIRNAVNLGSHDSIAKGYLLAKTSYVLVLGDDDFLIPGSIECIIKILEKKPIGLIYMNSKSFTDINYLPKINSIRNINYYIYNDNSIIKLMNLDVAFISSLIINKNYISKTLLYKFINGSFNQCTASLSAIEGDLPIVYIPNIMFLQRAMGQNDVSFKSFFDTFCINFIDFIESFYEVDTYIKNYLTNYILIQIIPNYLYQYRISTSKDESKKMFNYLNKRFSNYSQLIR